MTVCFTGHRSLMSHNISEALHSLEEILERLAKTGQEINFRAGGAVGFDTIAALCVIALKSEYSNIRLHLILPCPEQTKRWSEADIQKYNYILSVADSVTYTSDCYTRYCMMTRNRALVDGSELCIAYYDGKERGGTHYTVSYAKKKGVEVVNVY